MSNQSGSSQSNNFEVAMQTLLKHEGRGLYEDKQTGEISKYGVSLKFLQGIIPSADRLAIEEMTEKLAFTLYRNYFWEKNRIGEIHDQKLATAVMDITVNMGPGHIKETAGAKIVKDGGITLLQRTLNQLRMLTDDPLLIDGIMGRRTINLANTCLPREALKLYIEFVKARYTAIAAADPNHAKDIGGWINRANSLLA